MSGRHGRRRPALTALLIATAEVMAVKDGRAAPAERIAAAGLAASGTRGKLLLHCARCTIGRALLRWLERAALPGIVAHYRWRKRRIEAWTTQAIADGARQLVVLGAGLDSLPSRLAAAHLGLQVFEIDRAASIDLKGHALSDAGVDPGRIHLLAGDLCSPDPLSVLRDVPGFDPHASTVLIAEGVLMYLHPDAAVGLCRSLARSVSGPLQLIGTVMDLDAGGRPAFRHQPHWMRGWLRRQGEPFLWGVAAGALHTTLRSLGIEIVERAHPDAPADRDPCPGEWLWRGQLVHGLA